MLSIWVTALLFLPVFLVINLVAASPGREDLRAIARLGFRHFVIGTVAVFAGSAVLYFLMNWLISIRPLW